MEVTFKICRWLFRVRILNLKNSIATPGSIASHCSWASSVWLLCHFTITPCLAIPLRCNTLDIAYCKMSHWSHPWCHSPFFCIISASDTMFWTRFYGTDLVIQTHSIPYNIVSIVILIRNRFLGDSIPNLTINFTRKDSIHAFKFVGRNYCRLMDIMDQLNCCYALQVICFLCYDVHRLK